MNEVYAFDKRDYLVQIDQGAKMNFDELRKKRMEEGAKEHDGTGEGDWANWEKNQFLEAAQEELADCANYLDKMPAGKAKVLIPGLKQFYYAIEKEKKDETE